MSEVISPATLSSLIGMIYDAAINPNSWEIALEAVRVELNCGNSTLAIQSLPSGEVLLNKTTNIPREYLIRMADYGQEVLEQWGGISVISQLPLDRPVILSAINPQAVRFDLTKNRYSLEWARPQGLIDVLAIPLARDDKALGSVAFGRHESAGPFAAREFELAQLLVPHLQRAATINRLLDLSALARSTFAATIDVFAAPILLVTAELKLVHANPAAEEMLKNDQVLHLRDGIISALNTAVAKALAVAVTQAVVDETAIGRRGLGIPVQRFDGGKAALHVLPLRRGRINFDSEAAVAIFIARTDDPFVPPTDVVSALFGFTPSEGRVFNKIVLGRTVEETAADIGVSVPTVKSHLQHVFEKTGVGRQLDLLRIAISLSPPVMAGSAFHANSRGQAV